MQSDTTQSVIEEAHPGTTAFKDAILTMGKFLFMRISCVYCLGFLLLCVDQLIAETPLRPAEVGFAIAFGYFAGVLVEMRGKAAGRVALLDKEDGAVKRTLDAGAPVKHIEVGKASQGMSTLPVTSDSPATKPLRQRSL